LLDVEPLEPVADAPRTAVSLASDRRDPTLRPSTRYMALVVAGAREHGLPAEYVEALRAIPANEPTETALAFRALLDAVLRRRGRYEAAPPWAPRRCRTANTTSAPRVRSDSSAPI